jgi:hypothetical protein
VSPGGNIPQGRVRAGGTVEPAGTSLAVSKNYDIIVQTSNYDIIVQTMIS